jgi:hypothetical protein
MLICPYNYLHGIFPELMKQIHIKCGIAVGLQHELLAVFVVCFINSIQLYITSQTPLIPQTVHHTQISVPFKYITHSTSPVSCALDLKFVMKYKEKTIHHTVLISF